MIFKKAKFFDVIKNVYFKRTEPISLVHFLTNRCNARCSFCFIDFDNPKTFANELTLAEIEIFTKNLGNSLLNVNFTGGEPFARKEILDIAKLYYYNTTVQSIYITTNGSLPDRIKSFSSFFKEKNDLEITVQISIDSLPENHNKIRKINNLFDSCYEAYFMLKNMSDNINPVICITVSEENAANIKNIYLDFKNKYKFESIKCIAVRDEGVYKSNIDTKKKIYSAYEWLSKEIEKDIKDKVIKNYNKKSLQGRVHNKKDEISHNIIRKTYLNPHYISPCHAGALFGVIYPNGDVFPCEILENNKLGNLRDVNFDFMKIWNSKKTQETKEFILKSKCHCTYECALSYNILSNWRYQPSLIKASLINKISD
jgi:radical SAM protein with 4Fe4S-binding SPASM domain